MPVWLVLVLWFFLCPILFIAFTWAETMYLRQWREINHETMPIFPDIAYFDRGRNRTDAAFVAGQKRLNLLFERQGQIEIDRLRKRAMWLMIAAYAVSISFFCVLMFFWTGHSL